MAAPPVGLDDGVGQWLFAGAGINQHAQAALDQAVGHGGVTLDGPALGAPSGAGIDERDGPCTLDAKQSGRTRLRRRGRRAAAAARGRERRRRRRRGQFEVLLNDVRAMGGDALGKEPARGVLARLGLADQAPAAGHAATTAERMAPCRSRTAS